MVINSCTPLLFSSVFSINQHLTKCQGHLSALLVSVRVTCRWCKLATRGVTEAEDLHQSVSVTRIFLCVLMLAAARCYGNQLKLQRMRRDEAGRWHLVIKSCVSVDLWRMLKPSTFMVLWIVLEIFLIFDLLSPPPPPPCHPHTKYC